MPLDLLRPETESKPCSDREAVALLLAMVNWFASFEWSRVLQLSKTDQYYMIFIAPCCGNWSGEWWVVISKQVAIELANIPERWWNLQDHSLLWVEFCNHSHETSSKWEPGRRRNFRSASHSIPILFQCEQIPSPAETSWRCGILKAKSSKTWVHPWIIVW